MSDLYELAMLLGMVIVAAFFGGLVWALLCLLWQSRHDD